MEIGFEKYEAAGNDFIVVDASSFGEMESGAAVGRLVAVASKWCDRHFGIGADGILFIDRGTASAAHGRGTVAKMTIINSDGSLAEMCGNGIRCAARYIASRVLGVEGGLTIATDGGEQRVCFASGRDGDIAVEMGRCDYVRDVALELGNGLAFDGDEIDVGNPHFVVELCGNDAGLTPREARDAYGAEISRHREFRHGANVEFTREIAPNHLEMRVFERGVGPTLACGTGCVASAYAYCRKRGLSGVSVAIETEGGLLHVEIPEGIDWDEHVSKSGVKLIGGAKHVYSGVMALNDEAC